MKKWLLKGAVCLALGAFVALFAACSNTSGGGSPGGDAGSGGSNSGNNNVGGSSGSGSGSGGNSGGGSINDGSGTTFDGFFKSEIKGADLQVWQDWGGGFELQGSTVVVTGSWWGGRTLVRTKCSLT